MALETGTYISDLVATNPLGSDPKNQGDDHLRLIKSTVKTTFPNISGAVTPTHTELNYVDGVTANIQTQIDRSGVKVNSSRGITSPDTLTVSDVSKGLFYTSLSAGSCTLPVASTLNQGDCVCISNLGPAPLTINRASADTIFAKGQRGVTSIILQGGESIQLYRQDTTWLQLAGNNEIGSGVRVGGTRALTAPDTLTALDVGKGLFYNSASAGSCTLPAVSTLNDGDTICISNLGNGSLTINRASADIIFAKGQLSVASIILQRGESIQLYCQSAGDTWLQLAGNNGLGSGGQSWTDMAVARSIGTTYTNTSGRPILVSVNITSTVIGTIIATVGGVAIRGSGSSDVIERRFVNFVVPNNTTYKVDVEAGTPTIHTWAELR